MEKFKEEIKQLLDSADSEVIYLFFNSEVDSAEDGAQYRYCEEEVNAFFSELMGKGIDFVREDNHGGEGEGEDYWSVYKFTKNGKEDIYVQFQGWYQSYNGSEFDEWFFVKPKQVMVTQFDKVS